MSDAHEKTVELARKAKQLQEDEFFKQILVSITADTVKSMVTMMPGSPEAVAAHAELRAVERINQQLTRIVNAGSAIQGRR